LGDGTRNIQKWCYNPEESTNIYIRLYDGNTLMFPDVPCIGFPLKQSVAEWDRPPFAQVRFKVKLNIRDICIIYKVIQNELAWPCCLGHASDRVWRWLFCQEAVWARTVFNMNQVKGLQLATCRGAGAEMRRAVYFCSCWLATNHHQCCHDMKASYLVSCFFAIYIYIW
jgi:hypothetical protein